MSIEIEYGTIEEGGRMYSAKGFHPPEEFIKALLATGDHPGVVKPEDIKHQHIRYVRVPDDDLFNHSHYWMQTRKLGRGAKKITVFYPDGDEMGFAGEW